MANDIGEPEFCFRLECFLQEQLESRPDADSSPFFYILDKIYIYSLVLTTFYTPSDLYGTGGMHHECIHAVTSWRGYKPPYNCILVNTDKHAPGMLGLNVAWEKLFFSVTMNGKKYPHALVHRYSPVGDYFNENTGMWVVEPDIVDSKPQTAVIHLDTILCLAHLLPIYHDKLAPRDIEYTDFLDAFSKFYVSKFADHHAFEITF